MNVNHRATPGVARRLGATVLAGWLLLGLAGCSSDDASTAPTSAVDEAAPTDDGATDDGSTDDGSTDDGSTDDGSTDDGSTDDGGGVDCAADQAAGSDNLSGSATVLFTADSDGEASDSDITPETTLTVAADSSSMTPNELTVEVGQVFGVMMEAGGSIEGLVIGCAGGQTLVPNVAVGFLITEPGTYPVSLDIAGTELGSITVE